MAPREQVVECFELMQQLIAYRYDGFWAPMDTLKDKQMLETLAERGNRPWAVWDPHADGTGVMAAAPA